MTVTQDAFHDASFHVLQPKARGNRSGMDALLLAASMPKDASGIVADLGAGAGVAGFALINLNEDLELVAVERNKEMAELARQSSLLSQNAHLRDRIKVIEADVTLSGLNRQSAGLATDSVDHVIMNPPYNSQGARPPNDPLRAEAFIMAQGGLDAWFRTAAAMMQGDGYFSVIHRTDSLGEVIACSQGRFGNLEIIPIHSHAGEPAKRMIVRGIRGSKAPSCILPGFIVHSDEGKFTPHADAIFKGKAGL